MHVVSAPAPLTALLVPKQKVTAVEAPDAPTVALKVAELVVMAVDAPVVTVGLPIGVALSTFDSAPKGTPLTARIRTP